VTGVLAQRLVRVVCPECRVSREADPQSLLRLGLPQETALYTGAGCPACCGAGYAGRTAIGEALTMSDSLAEALLQRPRTRQLHELAVRHGMETLQEDGLEKVREGITTLEELRRVLPVDPPPAAPGEETE
jgi:type II secretory ATPase GspE/PulE/Tfp pilus assembly ATPase PilB-like protein